MDPVTWAAITATATEIGATIAANAGTIAAVSAAVGAVGTVAAGHQAVGAAKNEQMQLNRMSEERRAIASRNKAAADLERRQVLSRAQAVAAASGGSATDPTVLQLMAGIDKVGAVKAAEAWRQGAEEGAMLEFRGRTGVQTAKANRNVGYLTASGQMLSGLGDAFAKYGSGLKPDYGGAVAIDYGGIY